MSVAGEREEEDDVATPEVRTSHVIRPLKAGFTFRHIGENKTVMRKTIPATVR